MPLYNICIALDIRQLLLTFKENTEQDDRLSGGDITFWPASYQDSISSIQDGADHDCELCLMI